MKKAISKTPAEKAKVINRYTRKKLALNPEIRKDKKEFEEIVKTFIQEETKIEGRNYNNYNSVFSEVLRKNGYPDIVSFLKERYNETKKPVTIFDDGVGLGYFLKEIKQKLNNERIPNKTVGITLKKRTNNRLFLENEKAIDELHEVALEEFVPKERYTMIFSLYGGTHYTHHSIRFEQILKLAYSLEKKGVFCLGVSFFKSRYPEVYDNPKKLYEAILVLTKKGFGIDYFHDKWAMKDDPKDIFIIKRN